MVDSDGAGVVVFSSLGAGSYRVAIRVEGHWPFIKDFPATMSGEPIEVLIPRLAQMQVHVKDASGNPVVGREVQIWSLDYDKDTVAWQEAEVLQVSPVDWRTDALGVLSLPVIAEGNFRCSVTTESGETVSEEILVTPGQPNVATVVVGD